MIEPQNGPQTIGLVAYRAMRDPQQLEKTLATLFDATACDAIAIGSHHDDVGIALGAYRALRTDAAAMELARAGEDLLCRLDDMSCSSDRRWEAASLAVDPYLA